SCGTPTCQGGGSPGATTLTPSDGGTTVLTAHGEVQLRWTPAAQADRYLLNIRPVNRACGTAGTFCDVTVTGTSYTFRPDPDLGNRWFVRVRPISTDCGHYQGANYTATFTIMAQISGTFY